MWHTGPAVRYLVVGFGVDHALERVVVVAAEDGVAHLGHAPILVAAGDDRAADRMDEIGRPLRIEAGTARADDRVIQGSSWRSSAIRSSRESARRFRG